jgi:putative membrane protein
VIDEDDIPLVIRPIQAAAVVALPHPEWQTQHDPKAAPEERELINVSRIESAGPASVPENGSMSVIAPDASTASEQIVTDRPEEAADGAKLADDIPLVLSAPASTRRPDDISVASRRSVPKHATPAQKTRAFARLAILLAATALLALWLVQSLLSWVGQFASIHPTLGYGAYGLLGILAGTILILLIGQYRTYRQLDLLGDMQERLERARALRVSKVDDDKLRRDFQTRLDKLQAMGLISSEIRRSVLTVVVDMQEPGAWVEAASSRLLHDMDERVKEVIEREARLVGVSTALSPSGPLDTAIVLWRNARLVLRIAEIYGVRPGGYGSYRLLRRVVTNMVVAGLSQEAMQMLYAAYGPAAVEAASRGFRVLFDCLSKAGMALMAIEPITGGLVTVGGAIGKGASDLAGTAAAQITGPLLQVS